MGRESGGSDMQTYGWEWWTKLLAVLGLLLMIDPCSNRSSPEVTVSGKERIDLGVTGKSQSFQLATRSLMPHAGRTLEAECVVCLAPRQRK